LKLSEQLKAFFLEAALATYAATGKKAVKTTIVELPGSKVYRYERPDLGLLYVDVYVTNGEWSGGQTTIFLNGQAVWLHQYHGWCKGDDKAVLDFLKRALLTAYEQGLFYGGRGAEEMEDGDLRYENFCNEEDGYFFEGKGDEEILGGGKIFWHTYQYHMLALDREV